MGTSLGMDRRPIHVQPGIARLAQLERADRGPGLQTALDGVHRIAVGFFERLAPCDATTDGGHLGRENPVLVLKIINPELVPGLHALKANRSPPIRHSPTYTFFN